MADERLVLGIAVDDLSCSAEVRRVDTGDLLDSVTVAVEAGLEAWLKMEDPLPRWEQEEAVEHAAQE